MTNKLKCRTVLELAAMLLVLGPLQAAPPAAATAPTTRPIVSEPLTSQALALCRRQLLAATPPPLASPGSLSAVIVPGSHTAVLTWPLVTGVQLYRAFGSGLPPDGVLVGARQQPYRVASLAAGIANFTVASEYPCALYTPGLATAAVVVPP
jgi:hypothetical protein